MKAHEQALCVRARARFSQRAAQKHRKQRKQAAPALRGKFRLRHVAATFCFQERKGVPELTLAIAFLYLMTACWMSACTVIFPSPHGTTTRVLPKHTVTFMVRDPWSSSPGSEPGRGEEATSRNPSGSQAGAAAAWRFSPGSPPEEPGLRV